MAYGALSGFTVGITADRRREEQAELLRRRGARVVHGPAIRTLPLDDSPALEAATAALIERPPDVIVCTTGVGTRAWLASAQSLGMGEPLLHALQRAAVVARGPKAAGAAVTAGLDVNWQAASERSEEVLAHLLAGPVAGKRVAVQRDGGPRVDIPERLRAAGADVVEVPVYRWTLPDDPEPAARLAVAAAEGRLDALTFTSAPALDNFLEVAEGAGRREQLLRAINAGTVTVLCVGPVCAESAGQGGIERVVRPHVARLGAMVQALVEAFAGRALELELAGTTLRVQGALALVGSDHVQLTDRERGVLAVLAERPGSVVAKPTLRRRVWGADDVDEHAVEVTVARLRRRLGAAGPSLQTIPRRGYRLAVVA